LSCERRAFLARLRTDPIFLLQHVPALLSAVYRRMRTKAITAVASPHRGRKRWPDWVGDRVSIGLPSRSRSLVATQLPSYPGKASRTDRNAVGESSPAQTTADAEDQFARHRWGFLLTAMFEQQVDWQQGLEQCAHWIEVNTDADQQAWEPYSAGERVANLLVFLASMPLEQRQRQLAPTLTLFLDDSIDWIYGHLEYYGFLETNNHILGNARALVIGGVARDNAAAIDAGMRIFRRWLPELIMSGGFLRERSSHYQLIILNWLMDARHFLAASSQQRSADAEFLRGFSVQMLSAATTMCDSRGRLLALVGDVSPDSTPGLSVDRLALLYPDSWPAPAATPPAVQIRDGWFRISTGRDEVLGNFPAGPYPPRFPTHGHGDFTSFAWNHGAAEILTDPGRYRYTPDPVSLFQASAAGHNLPTVNGLAPVCESLLLNGRWWPRPYADATLEAFERDQAVVLAHNGFGRATPVTRHARQIALLDGELVVQDSFDGRGTVVVGWCWHFGPGFESFNAAGLTASGNCGEVSMSIEGLLESPRVAPLSGANPGSWRSCGYGQKQPGLGIGLYWNVELPTVVSTRFKLNLSGALRP
jgi:hypothetical protein